MVFLYYTLLLLKVHFRGGLSAPPSCRRKRTGENHREKETEYQQKGREPDYDICRLFHFKSFFMVMICR